MPKKTNPRDVALRNIKIMLLARGLRQKDLARRVNVTEGTLSNWLSGRIVMRLDDLDHICEVLHTTPVELYSPPEEVAKNCMRFIS